MKVSVVVVGLLILLQNTFAQNIPQVPSKMKFADMELHITKSGKHKIQQEVNKLRKSEAYFRKYVERADLHFPVIEQAFKEERCPDEIKYLVIQESSIVPTAVSSSNAVGYWQFKAPTGVEQGLKISGGIDERKNIKSASHAAGRYMVGNYKRIKNWVYTVMAYQTGVGGAQKHIKDKYRGAKKMEINAQTYWYVIKFLAHKIAYEHEVGKRATEQKLIVIAAKSGQSVKSIAKKHKVSVDDAKPYNEWVNISKKLPNDKTYYVILPVKNDGRPTVVNEPEYVDNKVEEGNTPSHASEIVVIAPSKSWTTIINDRKVVVPAEGETVVTLARKGEITQKKFRKYNELRSFEEVIPGIPYFFKAKKSKARVEYHTVQYGESLWSISQKFGMKSWSLRTKNRMSKTEALVPGRIMWLRSTRPDDTPVRYEKVKEPVAISSDIEEEESEEVVKEAGTVLKDSLSVEEVIEEKEVEEMTLQREEEKVETKIEPAAEVVVPAIVVSEVKEVEVKGGVYVVQQGDTYYGIAKKFDLSVDELKKMNELENKELSIGLELIVQKKESEVEPEVSVKEETVTATGDGFHIVQQGETLYSISKKYDINVELLKSWNDLQNQGLNIGQKIIVSEVEKEEVKIEEEIDEFIEYTVQQGDTMYGVSRKFNVSVDKILEWNNKNDNTLSVGDRLKIKKE